MYWRVVWCSGGCNWKCYKTLTSCSLLTRCTIPCACHAKRHLKVRTWCVLYILTSTCASRHNGVHFFDISTSKSGPKLVCFVHFDFDMCFAPQRRALFRHLNFQKWSERGVLCTFWLGNVLRATTACNFSSLIWSHKSLEKHSVSRLSYLFAHLHLLSSDSFSSNLSLLSDPFHLCFSSVHIVGSLTSKRSRVSSDRYKVPKI